MAINDAALLLLAVAFVFSLVLRLITKRIPTPHSDEIPEVTHPLPMIGSALQFVWNPMQFFKACRAACGPNFRARIGGNNFVFVSSPAALDALYRDRHKVLVAKRPVGRHPIGDVESEHFPALVDEVLIPVIARANARPIFQTLTPVFSRHLHTHLQRLHMQPGPVSLKHLVSYALFAAVMRAFFGDAFPVDPVYEDIQVIDAHAYYLFLPAAPLFSAPRRAKRRLRASLLAYMRPWVQSRGAADVPGVSAHGNEVLRTLAASPLSPEDQAGALQTYVWGVVTNITRVAHWTLLHVLADRTARARLQAALDAGVRAELAGSGCGLHDAEPAALGMPAFALLDSALKEAARLHSVPSSYRTASADMEFPAGEGAAGLGGRKTFWVRKGDTLAANVVGLHWDDRWFEDPGKFRIDRFLDTEVDRTRYLSMFGRGMHVCTGKAMANYFMKMFLIQCLHLYDLMPADGSEEIKLPSECPRGVTTTVPNEDVQVVLVKRTGIH